MSDSAIVKEVKQHRNKRKVREFCKDLVQTGKVGESALRAGYSDKSYGSKLLKNPEVLTELQKVMHETGINNKFLADKLHEGLNATTPTKYARDGAILQDEHPDFTTRHRYVETVIKVRGDFAPEKHQVEQRTITISVSPDFIKGLVDSDFIDAEEAEELKYEVINKDD